MGSQMNAASVVVADGRESVGSTQAFKDGLPSSALPWKVSSAVQALGSRSALAGYLDVARTQPGRWISGHEVPRVDTARLVKDLDYVWDRVTGEMGRESGTIWLDSPNGFLDGATPLDWLKRHGPSAVIAAFEAAEAGSYA